MAQIEDYIGNERQARMDAVTDPVFQSFYEASDLESITFDAGGGMQMQAQALSVEGSKRAVQRVIERAKQVGVDLKEWICNDFDLCGELGKGSVGDLMRKLDEFLRNQWTQVTTAALGVIAAFAQLASAVVLGKFIALLVALGVANNQFLELCDCVWPG